MSNTKPYFSLYLTFEEALANAREFKQTHKADDGKDLYIWEDPHDVYNQRMKVRTDEFYPTKTFDANIAEMFEVGTIEKEAKAALLYLIDRHKGFNPLELGQVIVGVMQAGFVGDREVAIFTYLSKADDCLRDFITEKAYELTDK